jgi:hypothetical protein
MFGALEVDMEVPDHLKGTFAEMSPVFKNTHVSRDDIGDHMKTYAEEQGIMNQKRKCMIGSIYGEKIMVISPLLKWYELVSPERHSIAYDKRTPGLFKEEYSGDGIIALCSKTYYCFGKEDKFSCKGINKRTNQITKDNYMDVLLSKKSGSSTNRGIRSMDSQVFIYFQERSGFSYFYPKRKVLADRVPTAPLEI